MPTIDPDLQKHYETYFDLFTHPGWKQLMDDMNAALSTDRETAIQRCKNGEEWQFERGSQFRTLKFLAFEQLMRNQYDAMTEPEPAEDELTGDIDEGLITE